MQIIQQARNARAAQRILGCAGVSLRNAALAGMAQELLDASEAILEINKSDMEAAAAGGKSAAFLERLMLNPKRMESMADGLRQVAALPDPLQKADAVWTRPNGLQITKWRVPLGVIGVIYESRPNVTSDAAALCLKSGNAVLLKGGSDAFGSNDAIACALRRALTKAGLPEDCVQMVSPSREAAEEMMRLNGDIDVLIPRGGAGLIQHVVQTATVPVIETGAGVCHVFVDASADPEMAVSIVHNAKVSRPSVCNSAETLLVHADAAEKLLPLCCEKLRAAGVRLYGDEQARKLFPDMQAATSESWDTEYNDLIMNVAVLPSIDAAIEHINRHGTHHSDCIVTRSMESAKAFKQRVESACVYVNASTRFTDGEEFGLGAEIGISTQKLHVRGPLGLEALTTMQYTIEGDGQIR